MRLKLIVLSLLLIPLSIVFLYQCEKYNRMKIISRYDSYRVLGEYYLLKDEKTCFDYKTVGVSNILLRLYLSPSQLADRSVDVSYKVPLGKEYFCDFSRSFDLSWWGVVKGAIYFPLYSFDCADQVCVSGNQEGILYLLESGGEDNLYFISSPSVDE